MKTLTVKVQDSVMQEFLNFIDKRKDSICIEKDKNLEYDPYFYQRQKKLHQIRDDIKSGKIEMISDEEFWHDIDKYTASLQK